ncbi:hypothetical protein vseg_018449 [Gypsophila vaccaria]
MRSIISLPQDILFDEILARLPVKSLIRFKTVCRSWYFIISSTEFAKTHLAFSSSRQVFLTEILETIRGYGRRSLHLLHYKEGNNVNAHIHRLVKLISKNYGIMECLVGCCNGIVCLSLYSKYHYVKQYILWNPATHEYREIDNPYGDCEAKAFGFGYASSIDDYKITAIYCDSKEKVNNVYLYSLKAGTWKKIVANIAWKVVHREYSLFYDDKIYWRGCKIIVAIDLVTEKWEEHSLMNWLSEYEYVNLFVEQKRLAYICKRKEGSCSDVWVMEKAGDWNSWNKAFSVDVGSSTTFLNASENVIYITKGRNRLELIDATGKTSRQFYWYRGGYHLVKKTRLYFDTLVSPFT